MAGRTVRVAMSDRAAPRSRRRKPCLPAARLPQTRRRGPLLDAPLLRADAGDRVGRQHRPQSRPLMIAPCFASPHRYWPNSSSIRSIWPRRGRGRSFLVRAFGESQSRSVECQSAFDSPRPASLPSRGEASKPRAEALAGVARTIGSNGRCAPESTPNCSRSPRITRARR